MLQGKWFSHEVTFQDDMVKTRNHFKHVLNLCLLVLYASYCFICWQSVRFPGT